MIQLIIISFVLVLAIVSSMIAVKDTIIYIRFSDTDKLLNRLKGFVYWIPATLWGLFYLLTNL